MTSPRVIYFGISPQKPASEVGGWSNVEQMGLKDALTYDTETREYHSYTKSEIINLIQSLQAADLIVSFNPLKFDYKILSNYTSIDLGALPNFDILSKIEETLNFPVSRDNLTQNTLNDFKNSKQWLTLKNRVEIAKKLFAHGCKEGYLSYYNNRYKTKEVCDTSNWADTARSMTERKHLSDPIVASSEPELPQFTPVPQIPEEALQIYDAARSQHHHAPALYTYEKMADLLDPDISSQQFNVAIVGLWLDQNPYKDNYGNFRHYYIDGSGTVAPERVNDYVDLRNIKEELVRGI